MDDDQENYVNGLIAFIQAVDKGKKKVNLTGLMS
jgi:hypothetical protein